MEMNPDRNALNGKVPTRAQYTNWTTPAGQCERARCGTAQAHTGQQHVEQIRIHQLELGRRALVRRLQLAQHLRHRDLGLRLQHGPGSAHAARAHNTRTIVGKLLFWRSLFLIFWILF